MVKAKHNNTTPIRIIFHIGCFQLSRHRASRMHSHIIAFDLVYFFPFLMKVNRNTTDNLPLEHKAHTPRIFIDTYAVSWYYNSYNHFCTFPAASIELFAQSLFFPLLSYIEEEMYGFDCNLFAIVCIIPFEQTNQWVNTSIKKRTKFSVYVINQRLNNELMNWNQQIGCVTNSLSGLMWVD